MNAGQDFTPWYTSKYYSNGITIWYCTLSRYVGKDSPLHVSIHYMFLNVMQAAASSKVPVT